MVFPLYFEVYDDDGFAVQSDNLSQMEIKSFSILRASESLYISMVFIDLECLTESWLYVVCRFVQPRPFLFVCPMSTGLFLWRSIYHETIRQGPVQFRIEHSCISRRLPFHQACYFVCFYQARCLVGLGTIGYSHRIDRSFARKRSGIKGLASFLDQKKRKSPYKKYIDSRENVRAFVKSSIVRPGLSDQKPGDF